MCLSFLLKSLGEGNWNLLFSITLSIMATCSFLKRLKVLLQIVSLSMVLSFWYQILAVDELHYYTGLLGRYVMSEDGYDLFLTVVFSHVAYTLRRFRRVCAAIGSTCLIGFFQVSLTPPMYVRSTHSLHLLQCNACQSCAAHEQDVLSRCLWTRRGVKWRRSIKQERIYNLESATNRSRGPCTRQKVFHFWSFPIDEILDEERNQGDPFLQGECYDDCLNPTVFQWPTVIRFGKSVSWYYIALIIRYSSSTNSTTKIGHENSQSWFKWWGSPRYFGESAILPWRCIFLHVWCVWVLAYFLP